MEESISIFSKTLGSFCNQLQNSCDALKQSVERRPIPLDSASSTFIQCLNRGVSSASSDLNLLETMSFGTVSFEELLGHCNEVYKNNQSHLLQLQQRLQSFGYVPEAEMDEEDEGSSMLTPVGLDSTENDGLDLSSSSYSSIIKSLEEDPLMDESLSLKSLGLSDVCLATLASEANTKIDDPDISMREPMKYYDDNLHNMKSPHQTAAKALGVVVEGGVEGDLKPPEAIRVILEVLKDNYESLPPYMKNLTSWEDLLTAVEKINLSLRKKEKTQGSNYFHQDEIASIGLGPKARTYLLLLVRMNHLVVETIDGLISYKVL